MLKLITRISFRYLKSQKHYHLPSVITTICFVGIMISVATLIIVMSVQNGFRSELIKKIIGANAHISIFKPSGIDDFDNLIKRISNDIDKITHLTPIIDGKGMIVNSKKNSSGGVIVTGIRQSDLLHKNIVLDKEENNSNNFKSGTIILGMELAWSIGVDIGDYVTLIAPEINDTIFGIIPRSKTFKIVGIVNIPMSQYNNISVFITFEDAQKFFRYQNSINLIEINIDNPENANVFANKIKKYLDYDFRILSWQKQNENMLNALSMEKNVMVLILGLFVIVTMFAIFAGLTMMVNDKNKSIAILRSMGISRNQVGLIFFFTGMIIVFIGTFLGTVIGLFLSFKIEKISKFIEKILNIKLFDENIYFVSTLPSDVHFNDIVAVIIFVFIFGIIITLLPAIKATKQDPGEALKYF